MWREGRVKKFKKFLDHILLLFDFEKKYFDKENIPNTFVGHPLIENNQNNKMIIESMLPKNKKIKGLKEMKKLLVILLLLFPVHGAWAEVIEEKQPEEIMELFGIKFGE